MPVVKLWNLAYCRAVRKCTGMRKSVSVCRYVGPGEAVMRRGIKPARLFVTGENRPATQTRAARGREATTTTTTTTPPRDGAMLNNFADAFYR